MGESELSIEIKTGPTELEKNIERWKVISGQEVTSEGVARLGGQGQVDLVRSGWEKWLTEGKKSNEETVAMGGAETVVRMTRLWNFDQEYQAAIAENPNLTDEENGRLLEKHNISEDDLQILSGGVAVETEEEEYQRLSTRLREGGQSGLTAEEMDRFYELDAEHNKVHYQELNEQVNNKINLGDGKEGSTEADEIWKDESEVVDGGAGGGEGEKGPWDIDEEEAAVAEEAGGRDLPEEEDVVLVEGGDGGLPEEDGAEKLPNPLTGEGEGEPEAAVAEEDNRRDVTVEAGREVVPEAIIAQEGDQGVVSTGGVNEQREALQRVKAEMDRQKEKSFAGRFANFMGGIRERVAQGAEAGRVAMGRLAGIGERVRVRIEESKARGKDRRRTRIEEEIVGLKDTIDYINQVDEKHLTPNLRGADRGWWAEYYQSRVDRLDRKLQRMDSRRQETEDNERIKLSLAERLKGWVNSSRLQAAQA